MNLFHIPEIGSFAMVNTERLEHALEHCLQHAEHSIQQRLAEQLAPSWDNLPEFIHQTCEPLTKVWGVVSHLKSVMGHDDIRQLYHRWLPKITIFWTELGHNRALYQAYNNLRDSPSFASLNHEQQASLEKSLRDFRLSGVALDDEPKRRFSELSQEMSSLVASFEEHVVDATDAFSYLAKPEEVAGIPESILEGFEQQDGIYRLNLRIPCYLPIMQYAHDAALRERFYHAYVTRASELGHHPDWDNTSIIQKRLLVCDERARLLGFQHFAEYSLADKMAKTPEEVFEFLRKLAQKAKARALKDIEDLKVFSGQEDLNAWDVAYYSEQLRQKHYGFSEHEVRQYFPLEKVLHGLFTLIRSLYDVDIKTEQSPAWHPDVQYVELWHQKELLGAAYLDLFAREGKRSGAWMDNAQDRHQHHGHLQYPIAYLVCNFTAPTQHQPCLLTHDEVSTLFHEFGHGLHHLLTQVGVADIAGIQGVEWDAVELPSQFMENFCWEWDIVQAMSAHVKTGEPITRALFDKMLAAKNFQSGLQTLRQVEFALFDMSLYAQHPPAQDYQQVLDLVRHEVAVLFPPRYNRFANSFSHIFAGGYAAGYYSYKWAEVLSCDAYAAFEEKPDSHRLLGKKFWQEILAVGSSRPASESFLAFRGREPSMDPLLRLTGLMEA